MMRVATDAIRSQEKYEMVHGPHLIPFHSELKIRKLSSQLTALKRGLKSLGSEHAERLIKAFDGRMYDGYAGMVAVPRLDHSGFARIPDAAQGWHEATDWGIRTGIRGIEVKKFFNPEDFELDQRTLEAFEELERRQGAPDDHQVEHNAVRVFPIRTTSDPDPELRDGEFLLDLASHMWILATHPDWRTHAGDALLFRCLAEKFKPMNTLGERAILVGYRPPTRAVNFSSTKKNEGVVIIGCIPNF